MDNLLYDRIKKLCSRRNTTITKLESDLGFSKGSIKKWGKTSSPSIDKVVKVATYFNVSVDYLAGMSEIACSMTDVLNDKDIISIQKAMQKMSAKDKDKMMQILNLGFEYAFSDDDNK